MESYLKVKAEVETNEAEQGFFEDIFVSLTALSKRFTYGWPAHAKLVAHLHTVPKNVISYSNLRKISSNEGMSWSLQSIKSFIKHYHSTFDFLRYNEKEQQRINWNEVRGTQPST